ncbi:hypothetical protein N7532_004660 [Penicillium argentinense]|uniref:Uncharacterized protein n=1 Tax=Penicillium argentinense TaxID=1131581 RepID=A0A9W9KFR2_9EURO|nr:uncharacterized protein N7532_004660 [Penicillium argentinense]KAJ5104131.1 hypothetical protein N7532_004660 [Penicillium argentinense]
MPPKVSQEPSTMPEAQGLKYDEYEMAFFMAKLSYHSTAEERMASSDSNLASISEAQAKILKLWDMLRQKEKELAEKGKSLSPTEKRQLRQYAWRFEQLEKTATKTTGE